MYLFLDDILRSDGHNRGEIRIPSEFGPSFAKAGDAGIF